MPIANICKNNRKVAIVNNTRKLLRPILWYLEQLKLKNVIKMFEDICSLEEQKINDERDDDFYKKIIELLNILDCSDDTRILQFKFLTISEIRSEIIDELKHNLPQQRRKNG